jgi:PDZ domain-containing protein
VVRGALVALVVVVALGLVASRISTHDYAITPGGAEPVGPLITIDGQHGSGAGKVLLTDVYLTPLSWLSYLSAWLDKDADIVSQDELVEPGVPVSELDAQGYLEMAQAKQSAQVAALHRLGYPVGASPEGSVITAVGSNTPASSKLAVADVIVGVDGMPTTTACAVIRATHELPAGTVVDLSVRPANISRDGIIANGPPVTERIRLAAAPSSDRTTPCPGISGPPKGYLGIAIGDEVAYSFPFRITISTPNIGGPSAGLAMTLGIIDQLSHGQLLRGHTIAATGTIAPSGLVGDVGGVRQKAVAVTKAGAVLFLVPRFEQDAAQAGVGRGVKVDPVATLNQALDVLLAGGGSITMADGSSESRDKSSTGS